MEQSKIYSKIIKYGLGYFKWIKLTMRKTDFKLELMKCFFFMCI